MLAAPALLLAGPVAAQPAEGDAVRLTLPEPQTSRIAHNVRLEAGQRYVITAESEDFDPYMRLIRGGSGEVIAEDDDSGGGLTPRIVFTPSQTGDYVVQVSSYAPGGHGNVALNVAVQPPLPALITRPARTERGQWQIFEGRLNESTPTDLGRPFHDYELRLAAGETAMIHVVGDEDLDAMLQVFSLADRGNQPLAEDDDSGGGLNPFIMFAPEEPGTYVVRVIGFDPENRGAYRLRIFR